MVAFLLLSVRANFQKATAFGAHDSRLAVTEYNVFLYDRLLGITTRVSVPPAVSAVVGSAACCEGASSSSTIAKCSLTDRLAGKCCDQKPCRIGGLNPEISRDGQKIVFISDVNYEGAGTVEFLLDREGGFYFMEMNTRIQVEHPVTEMVTGIDLIAEQLRIAGGEPISVRQDDIQLRGHAIECRINAEDARHNFRPAPGRITGWLPPGGPGVRVDSHVYTGYDIPPFYDSLIGKVIVWGTDREHALTRMKRALNECAVTGIPTTVDFHLEMLNRPEFIRGDVHTKFVEQDMLP